jgi:enoyl-CoA hydratase/carnithine racemase
MTRSHVYLERSGEIARLVINRPEKRNALSLAMWGEIPQLMKEVAADKKMKILILQGVDETAFAAGADIEEIAEHADTEARAWLFMDAVHAAETAIGLCEKPVIAMIRGDCIGGGVELALACDLRFAATGARFGIPPAKLGLVYSLASTKRLVEMVGPGLASDYLFSGRIFDLAEARAAGLVDREYQATEIVAETQAYAETLCRRSQWSIRAAKSIIRAAISGAAEESVHIRRLRAGAFLGADLQEGVHAFRERRPAAFPWS